MKWIILVMTLALAACATNQAGNEFPMAPVSVSETQVDNLDDSILRAQRRSVGRIEVKDLTLEDASNLEKSDEPGLKVNEPKYLMDTKNHLPRVKKWIRYYSKKDRKRFQRFLNRGAQYKQVIQDLFVANGLPPDLYFLGILESGFVTKAISHAGAVGPWQFMAPTGRQYGLKINNYVDERVDTVRATLAAVKYLKELYRQKKSWYMALAAYNAGPGRVRRAVRRGGSRNYWKLTKRRLLPYDTREYIPQFLAILSIGKNLERYGFVEEPEKEFVKRELVEVPSPVKLKRVAEVSGVPLETIQAMNPQLLKGMTPPTKKKSYPIWIPKHQVTLVQNSFSALKSFRIAGLKVRRPASIRSYNKTHKVRRGQNLTSIARRYGTSVRKIKKLNRLRSNRIFAGQKLKIKSRKKGRVRRVARKKASHRVRRGETLTGISRKYGVRLSTLKKINGIKRSRIFVGQKLRLKKKQARVSKKKVKKYRIRRGDNLYKIARRFGTTIRRLKKMNNLKGNRIMKGQTLVVASK